MSRRGKRFLTPPVEKRSQLTLSVQWSLEEPLDGGLEAPSSASPWLLVECCADVTVVVTICDVARYWWVNPSRTRHFWLLKQELMFRPFLETIYSSEWVSSLMRWTYELFIPLMTVVFSQVVVLVRGERQHQRYFDVLLSVTSYMCIFSCMSSRVG